MNQEERMDYLIQELSQESEEYKNMIVPKAERRRVLRSLMNLRMPGAISPDFLKIQDAYLTEEISEKGIVDLSHIPTLREQYGSRMEYADRISIWQGDITRLSVDAIVNAANSQMLGCFYPCHRCIDNAIHSAAGLELREECARIMRRQGHEEPVGSAKITKGYNLPAKYVIHTVGPVVYAALTGKDRKQLADCYCSCLKLAESYHLKSIAFCCISTGEFHFPNKDAAEIAVETVKNFMKDSRLERVIFNVFKDFDREIYEGYVR